MRLGSGPIEELGRVAHRHSEPMRRLDHLGCWATTSVPRPEQVERAVGAIRVLEVAHAHLELVAREISVVRVRGREMREHSCPVDPLPPERVVLGRVGVVPRQLLGQEVVAA